MMNTANIFLIILSVLIISSTVYAAGVGTEKTFLLMDGEKMYIHYCASCHGDKGDGKGFNAKNLDPRPAVHTDAKFMSKKTDKDLQDAINGGGKTVGKSTLMPPWGTTLSEAQVHSLVLYLRSLCNCQEL